MEWLYHNRTPWDLVASHWAKTFNTRHAEWKTSEDINLVQIFQKWSILCMPDSYKLILSDFKDMKLSTTEVTIEIWMDFFKKLTKKCAINKKDDSACALKDIITDPVMKDGNDREIENYVRFLHIK